MPEYTNNDRLWFGLSLGIVGTILVKDWIKKARQINKIRATGAVPPPPKQ